MEIAEIKQNLSLESILQHYNLKQDKNNMLRCPFHDDSTASLQVSFSQNKYKCHACDKKGDVIQFVQDYEKLTKHEALVKCASLANGSMSQSKPIMTTIAQPTTDSQERITFLEKIFSSFKNASTRSQPAKEYLQQRNLDLKKLEVGYNGGQFHHGARKDETLINQCLEYGLLIDKGNKGRTGETAYTVFGKWCIVFALRNRENKVVSLYFRSTLNEKESKHFYLKNRQGLYPNYPNVNTKKLILTESIIDGASLLQVNQIAENYSLLACYGTNGLTEEHIKAIKELKQLEEIIFAFDNDTAGKEAITKYASLLLEEVPTIKISVLEPINKGITNIRYNHLNLPTEITFNNNSQTRINYTCTNYLYKIV